MTTTKIAMGHYGIGGKDGVNTVIFRNLTGIFEDLNQDFRITLFGAADSGIKDFVNRASESNLDYIDIPDFAPGYNGRDVSKQKAIDYLYEGEKIADRLAEVLADYKLVIMENTTVGNHPAVSYAFYVYAQWCLKHQPDKRIILRTHDFLQDRPENFDNIKKFKPRTSRLVPDWRVIMYPSFSNVFYITLNTQNMYDLYSHGVDKESIFCLPNSIDDGLKIVDDRHAGLRVRMNDEFGINPEAKIVFYPVRCVPRKNVEEAILVVMLLNRISSVNSALSRQYNVSGRYHLVVSLDDTSPKTAGYSRFIKGIVKEHQLPVVVGLDKLVGLNRTYDKDGEIETYGVADAFGVSDMVVTTSYLEGFGFVYIEPWMADCVVIGRNLPIVTRDFKKMGGMKLGHLYDTLHAEGTDFKDFGTVPDIFKTTSNAFDEDSMKKKFDYILRLMNDDALLELFLGQNEFQLNSMFTVLGSGREKELIAHNRQAVQRNYSREAVSKKLHTIVKEVMSRPVAD